MTDAAGSSGIDPLSDRPVYKQIADILRAQMDGGHLAPGAKLPSETELTVRFGTARGTVRDALQILASEGRTRSERGVGVFVREQPVVVLRDRHDRLARKHRQTGKGPLHVDAAAAGVTLDQVVLGVAEVPAPPDVAGRLGIAAGETVLVRRRRVDLTDGTPLQLANSYIPLDLADEQIRDPERTGVTYARIEEQGHVLTRFTEELTFRMPAPDEAIALRLSAGVPIIRLVRVAYAGKRAVECFVAVMAGDKYELEYRIDADRPTG